MGSMWNYVDRIRVIGGALFFVGPSTIKNVTGRVSSSGANLGTVASAGSTFGASPCVCWTIQQLIFSKAHPGNGFQFMCTLLKCACPGDILTTFSYGFSGVTPTIVIGVTNWALAFESSGQAVWAKMTKTAASDCAFYPNTVNGFCNPLCKATLGNPPTLYTPPSGIIGSDADYIRITGGGFDYYNPTGAPVCA